ncbi:hypothetical protein HYDPIDRAFT_154960 [Hydnomerulius pinastri MD-312]|uniref:HMG box domain-containing protein n=1 Tax=Hydnomerulius pinastri MD-312 TaxID=994086 RepID=A0A0C9W8S9_9AGAM|nr:hypothetical protein HYDPIDRAFT_154960 [Hydnomerulius pinastri MD-312]
MHRYNPELEGRHAPVAEHSGAFNASLKELGRVDDQGSPSGSEDDAGYPVYPDAHKMEAEVDDDPNAALTSQTLNADGTPKRPMNAFMIFARRRRPQVSAENQSMRTGEVSKILSREWNAMNLSEKQFYLDQAKLLKDNFNQKYPDYVYRRRPNNSRKRRKTDAGTSLSADHHSVSDAVEDYSGGTEYGDISPVDVAEADESRYGGHEIRYPSLPADGSVYSGSQSRASSYQPSEVSSYRPLGDTRVAYMSSRHGRATPDIGMGPSTSSVSRGSEHSTPYYHPYLPAQHQHHAQTSSYFPDSSGGGEVWPPTRDDQTPLHMQPWPQSSQDQSALVGEDRHRGYAPPGPSHGWVNAGSSESISSSSASGTHTPSYGFPTLNSPFYPNQTNPQENYSSSPAPPLGAPQHYGSVAQMQGSSLPGRSNAAYEGRTYPSHSSLQQAYPPSSSTAMSSYHQQSRNAPLTLPSAQPGSSYSHVQSASPSSPAGSGADSSQLRYWSRDKLDN